MHLHGENPWGRHPHVRSGNQLTFGEKAADIMRNGFGSWAFVGAFCLFLAGWMALNSAALRQHGFDPYPYILLNLCLSCLAALQGAFILIAQKRADRVAAEEAFAHYQDTGKLMAQVEHMQAELNLLREYLIPSEPNPSQGSDAAAEDVLPCVCLDDAGE